MVDAALTAVLLVAGLTLGLAEFGYLGQRPEGALSAGTPILLVVAATVAIVTPLAWRRRAPLTVLMLVTGITTVSMTLLQVVNQVILISAWLAMYSASAYGAKRRRIAAAAIALGAMWAASIYHRAVNGPRLDRELLLGLEVLNLHWLVWGAVAYALGHAMRVGRAREAELRIRTAQLAAEREANAHRAVLEERVRVARELHDVIAHHVSLMGIQAAVARRVLTTRPDQATKALASIEGSSRQAVGELHRMVGFLRQDNEDDFLAAPPSLRRLDGLITQLPDASLAVKVHVEGEQQPLPPSVDLSAYRVVQEALTNTLKHAEATTAAMTLRYRDEVFEVEVVDNGVGIAAAARMGNGLQRHGLIGMRERVALHRGQFEAGPRADGGFGVRASFPLAEQS